MKKINEPQSVKCTLYLKGRTEYILKFNKFENERIIRQGYINKDPLTKQFIEMIIRDILNANPRLELYKGFFIITDDKHRIETDNVSLSFYPCFTISFIETDSGNYLNVTLKNKIIQNETILDYLEHYNYDQKIIKAELIGRPFKVSYAKRNYKIDDILFDRNPNNQIINYEGKAITLIEYYEIAHKLKIIDQNQPLILVKRRDSQENLVNLYFIPEFCHLTGLNENISHNYRLLKEIVNLSKIVPQKRFNKTNEFIELLVDSRKDKKYSDNLSAKEKTELYGIEVKRVNNTFTAYYMKDTKLIGGDGKQVNFNDRSFTVYKKSDMRNWLFFYEKINYNAAENLYNTLSKVSKSFGLKISEPEWIEMPNNSQARNWTDVADDYFERGKRDYNFVIFLLGKNDNLIFM